MKNFTLMNEHDVVSLLESLDDLRFLLERIIDRGTVEVPEPWDHASELSLDELF